MLACASTGLGLDGAGPRRGWASMQLMVFVHMHAGTHARMYACMCMHVRCTLQHRHTCSHTCLLGLETGTAFGQGKLHVLSRFKVGLQCRESRLQLSNTNPHRGYVRACVRACMRAGVRACVQAGGRVAGVGLWSFLPFSSQQSVQHHTYD